MLGKIDDEPVDEVKEALIAFFEREGGYAQVAKVIESNAQQLYYIISGRNAPTLKTVMRILRYYPNEIELRRALSLPVVEKSEESNQNATSDSKPPVVDVDSSGKPWQKVAEEYRLKYERILAKLLKRDHPDLFADLEEVKKRSNGQTTDQPAERNYIGYVLSYQQQEFANAQLDGLNAFLEGIGSMQTAGVVQG